MAKTFSSMLPLGTRAPEFSLPDTEGRIVHLSHYHEAKGYLVMFICNHCPYVVHIRDSFVALAKDLQKLGLQVFAINSNDAVAYPEDSPQQMKVYAKKYHYTFPYLYDETQAVAKAYQAACTPDFFLFDESKHLVYRGQLDASRPGNKIESDGADLRKAVENLLNKKPISSDQKPSLGCNIKWRSE